MARPLPDEDGLAAAVLTTNAARSVRLDQPIEAALIVVPLRGRERVLGVLHLKRVGRGARFETREFDLVRLFGAHVSIALQNALAHRAVTLRAQMDSMTGLKNQGTFEDELVDAIDLGDEVALLMIDLDDFKGFNDRHGHEAGNALLRSLAAALRQACREDDQIYRYGGDEFAVILPRTQRAGALEVAERVRRTVADVRVPGHQGGGVRCSIGVATYPGDAANRVELLLAADRALYAAKRSGRDRVASAQDGQELAGEFPPQPTPLDEHERASAL
jgi:diguanylate cyclase (GGDEF)-like protein